MALAVFAVGPALNRLLPQPVFDVFILARIPVSAFALGFCLPRGFPGASVGVGLATWFALTSLPAGASGVAGKSLTKAFWWIVPIVALLMEFCGSWLRKNIHAQRRRD